MKFPGVWLSPYLAAAVLAGLMAPPLQARTVDYSGIKEPLFTLVQQSGVSRSEAAEIVKRRYGGKILAISVVKRDGRRMYRVKGLSDQSQVYVVYVDKKTGRISS
ncbi:PepSY domain-containing protein [Microbulbifer sp. TYP-18]|uniref:PepSY domain-containing protein n=1 Tax=Microbulbifer sp. TYP-18 TaxID=3230024 RepID=UPI0034C69CFE